MQIIGYKCKHCDFETNKRGWRLGQLDIEEHLKEIHGIETDIGKNVIPIESKPAKLWKCPDCGQEMSYYLKYYHQQNAKTKCVTLNP